jgi:hypothetical protein
MFVSEVFDEASEILGTTDQSKVFRVLTQAVQALMESGHWLNSQKEVDVCTGWDGQTITLPKDVEIPLAIQVDGTPVYFRSKYFEYHVNRGGTFDNVNWAWDDKGLVATVEDIRQPSQLVAVAEHDNDVGKQIRVLGTDRYNRPLRTQLEDGTLLDGKMVTVHSQKDFAYGAITPDGNDIETRTAAIAPLSALATEYGDTHTFTDGEPLQFSTGTTGLPSPLTATSTYYAGVVDSQTIQLYNSSFDAINDNNPIQYTSVPASVSFVGSISGTNLTTDPSVTLTPGMGISGPGVAFGTTVSSGNGGGSWTISPSQTVASGTSMVASKIYTLSDNRKTSVQSILQLSNTFATTYPNFPIPAGTEIVFLGSNLPSQLVSGTTYFAAPASTSQTQLFVYATLQDSQNGTNPINLSYKANVSQTATFSAYIRKAINPETVLYFSAGHYFNTGDQVQVATNGGTLPQPLLPSINYYVYKIDGKNITLHSNLSDSSTGINPIILTSQGNGSLSVVKLIPGTVTPGAGGTSNNVNVNGQIVPSAASPTTVAQIKAIATGSITSASTSAVGSGYTSPPSVVIFEEGGANYTTPSGTTFSTSVGTVGSSTSFAVSQNRTSQSLGQATFQCTVSNGIVSSVSVTSVGATNFQPGDLIFLYSPTGVGSGAVIQVTGSSGVVVNDTTSVDLTNTSTAGKVTQTGSNTILMTSTSALVGGNTATATISTDTSNKVSGITLTGFGSGYMSTPKAIIYGSAGSGAKAVLTISKSFVSQYLIQNPGAGYSTAPYLQVSTQGTQNATAVAQISGGAVVSVAPVAQGVGYSTDPTVSPVVSTGAFVVFSSTGTLPSPLQAGVSYRVELPNSTGFTVKNADFTPLTITDSGSGVLFVELASSFGVSFSSSGYWAGDFSSLTPGTSYSISFGTDYALPTTTPAISTGTTYNLVPVNSTRAVISTTGGSPSTITVSAFGVGQSYYQTQDSSALAKPLGSGILIPNPISYLSNGTKVVFTTTGTASNPLPTGISANTIYLLISNGAGYSLTDTSGNPITISGVGSGQLTLSASHIFNFSPSTYIIADSSLLETGDAITPRPQDGDILDPALASHGSAGKDPVFGYGPASGLWPSNSSATFNASGVVVFGYSPVYVRRLSENYFELYPTKAQAQNLVSTAGRLSYTTIGNTINSTFLVDSVGYPTLVKTVDHVDKPISDGYISLYAWDYGRSNDMTLIGQYHPTEINPRYRRIRIGKPAAWVRILYRVKCPTISSVYDYIPLEQTRAIINATHAIDLENKDFFEQAEKYWAKAYRYLMNQQEVLDGHAMTPIQVNGVTYGDKTDDVMF